MRTLKISLLVFILSITVSAQWFWQNPTPFGYTLFDIQFLNTSIGYACGNSGKIIKTTNGGENWFEINSGTEDLIIDIFFLSEEVGWFITYNEQNICKTTNGGLNWEIIGNLLPRYAYSLWFKDEMNGFGVGYQYLLSTTNGGITWNENNSVSLTKAIYFLNSNVGFIGGTNIIYKTTNGGTNWTTINSIPTPEFSPSKIFALDQNKIFMVGSGIDWWGNPINAFLKSTNGGISWDSTNLEYWLTDVYFKSLTEGWICSDKLYKTNDGGDTWNPTDFVTSNFTFIEANSWAISGFNTIIYSADNWLSANQQIKSVFSGYLWNGAAKDTNVVFACGSNNTIVGTFDGGKQWNKYFDSPNHSYLNAVTFRNNEIWVVGEYGIVINSKDNGSTWTETYIDATWLSDIKFLTDDIGYIVGTDYGDATIFNTRDGGNTWNIQQTFTEYDNIDGIEFANVNLGWMIANQNGLLKSTDLGQTWSVVIDSILHFTDIAVWENSAWFTYSNLVLRTTDAGITWESFKVFDYGPTLYWGFEIDFLNSTLGYAGIYDGRVLVTNDGGESWIEEETFTKAPIQAIDFVDTKRGWTFGDYGTILKRDPNYVSVEGEIENYPNNFLLSQNYPNPFNPVTSIQYAVSGRQFVTLKVYDLLGREVATLVNEEKPVGDYEVEFNSASHSGNVRNLPSGIYFYQLNAGQFSETKKMILLK